GVRADSPGPWVTGGPGRRGGAPAWLRRRSRRGSAVAARADELSERIDEAGRARPAAGTADVVKRLEGVTAILRLEYLDRLHKDLGKVEAQATVLKLLAPALTAAWRFFRPF